MIFANIRILKFIQCQKSGKAQFIIYGDFERWI